MGAMNPLVEFATWVGFAPHARPSAVCQAQYLIRTKADVRSRPTGVVFHVSPNRI